MIDKERKRRWYKNNKDKVAACRRAWKEANLEKIRAAQTKRRESGHSAEWQREDRKKFPDKYTVYGKSYREKNKDKYAAALKLRAESNVKRFLEIKLAACKASTKKRKSCGVCEIDTNFLLNLWEKQNRKCALSGIEMVTKYRTLNQVSVDRIDSSIGYTKANVQLVCKALNLGKTNQSNQDMIDFIRLIRAT